jgi:hypothetical protein
MSNTLNCRILIIQSYIFKCYASKELIFFTMLLLFVACYTVDVNIPFCKYSHKVYCSYMSVPYNYAFTF